MHRDELTLERMRNRIREYLEEKPLEPIPEPKKFKFTAMGNLAPDHRRVTVNLRLTLATYHRIAEVMRTHKCGISDAVEAMLMDVEAQKVSPIDLNWKDRYSGKKKSLWQSFDLYKRIGIRKKKNDRDYRH